MKDGRSDSGPELAKLGSESTYTPVGGSESNKDRHGDDSQAIEDRRDGREDDLKYFIFGRRRSSVPPSPAPSLLITLNRIDHTNIEKTPPKSHPKLYLH
jgi:hypothetical protein